MLRAAARVGAAAGRMYSNQSQLKTSKESRAIWLLNFPTRLSNLSLSLTCRATYTRLQARTELLCWHAQHEFESNPKRAFTARQQQVRMCQLRAGPSPGAAGWQRSQMRPMIASHEAV